MNVFTTDEFDRKIREDFLKIQMLNVWISYEEFYSDLDIEKIEQLTAFMCDFLKVGKPIIKLLDNIDNAYANTVFCMKNGKTEVSHIEFLKRHLKFTGEEERIILLQSIAHEVRHIWQFHNQLIEFNMDQVYTDSVDEIDAIAFSRLFLGFFASSQFIIEDKELDRKVTRIENLIYTDFIFRVVQENQRIKFQWS